MKQKDNRFYREPEQPINKKYVPYGMNGEYYVYDNETNHIPIGHGKGGTKKEIQKICDALNTSPSPEVKEDGYADKLLINMYGKADNGRIQVGLEKAGEYILEMYKIAEAQKYAARIVECWNNYDKVKADNEKLLKDCAIFKKAHEIESTVTSLQRDENEALKAANEKLQEQLAAMKDAGFKWFDLLQKADVANRELIEALKACAVGIIGMLPANVAIDNAIQMTAYNAYHLAKLLIEKHSK